VNGGECGNRGRCVAHGLQDCHSAFPDGPREGSWDDDAGRDVPTGCAILALLAFVAVLAMVVTIIAYVI
jgi:hypothetical protein